MVEKTPICTMQVGIFFMYSKGEIKNMSDQNKVEPGSASPDQGFTPSTPKQADQPVETSGQQQQDPSANQQFLTKADESRIIEEAFRRAQGLYERGNQRIRQRVEDLEAVWSDYEEAGGPPLTEAQKNRMRLAVADRVRAEELEPSERAPENEQPPRPLHFDIVDQILSRNGIPIDAPEVDALRAYPEWQDPVKMIEFTQQQVRAYQERTASPNQPETPQPANVARTPTLVGGGQPAGGSVDEEYRRGMAELVKRRASHIEKLRYRDEMRRKGANI